MSTPVTLFRKHLQIIKEMGFQVVKEITEPYNQIQITFDDGFQGVYTHKDLLISQNIFPTIFMITSLIGESSYLTEGELVELKNLDFNIQSHTHTHKDLNTLTREELYFELRESKEILETKLHDEITGLCFPKGLFNDLVLEVCESVGYKKWYCSIPGNSMDIGLSSKLKFRNLVQFSEPTAFRNILLGGLKFFINRYSIQHYGKKIHIS
jgi:peptidoglycan/xylan/chitin deacetylase (PgdA/CDA1 family)